MITHRLFGMVSPLGIAVAVQFENIPDGTPAWIVAIGFIFGLTVWVAKLMGRLPGNNGDRQLNSMHKLLGFRAEGKMERFLEMDKKVSDTAELMAAVVRTNEKIAESSSSMEKHMEVLSKHIQRSA